MPYEPKLIQIAAKGDTDNLYALDDDGNVWELLCFFNADECKNSWRWRFIGSPIAADAKNKQ